MKTKNSDNISSASWSMTTFAAFGNTSIRNSNFVFDQIHDSDGIISARCFTVLVESGDKMLLANSMTSLTTSAAVYVAAFYFKKVKKIE